MMGDQMAGEERKERLVRYLMRELSDEEQDRVEEEYFAQDDLHDELLCLEQELIDEYLQGNRSARWKKRFEKSFLTCPERFEQLELARALRELRTPEAKQERPCRRWLPLPRGLSYAVVVIVVVFVAIMVVRRVQFNPSFRSSQNTTQNSTPVPREPNKQGQNRDSQPVQPKESTPELPLLAIAMPPASDRTAGAELTLELPDLPHRVELTLDLEEGLQFPSYQAILTRTGSGQVMTFRDLKAVETSGSRPSTRVVISILSQTLRPGAYKLELDGLQANGQTAPISGYTLRLSAPRPSP